MKLQIVDNLGNVLKETELVLENGDILLCCVENLISRGMVEHIYKTLTQTLSSKESSPKVLICPSNIEFKIIKVNKDEK